jgi:3-phenylpropionate/trans-cinnamate dioxygenase ferredoxin subunit
MTMPWHHLGKADKIATPFKLYPFQLKNQNQQIWEIIVYQIENQLYAMLDQCPHRRVPISSKGYFENQKLVCGWHLWQFDPKSGTHVAPPTGNCVPMYPIKIEDEELWVSIDLESTPPF